jgi:hypothetical protein
MRRFLALATLLVLSLSRFGAPVPAHARTWVVERVTSELGTAVPGARLAAPAARELAQRVVPRALVPWLPFADAQRSGLELSSVARPRTPQLVTRAPLDAWYRFTYDATAPPRLS